VSLTLVATAGAANANSYATIAEANTYHETRLYIGQWNSESAPRREQALVWATRLLDTHFEWNGVPSTQTQALRWPRTGAYDRDARRFATDTIPQRLKDATSEFARWLLENDRTGESTGGDDAIQSVKVGSIEVQYAGSGATTSDNVVPDVVVGILAGMGQYKNKPGTSGAVSLRRG
jgi:hypothetical protein